MPKNLMDALKGRTFEKRIKARAENINMEERKISFIIVSENNAGERFDWWEGKVYIEELDPRGAVLDELCTFFKDHVLNVDTAIGRIENKRLEDGKIKCDVIFGSDEDSLKIFQKYVELILTDVSIGYTIDETIETEKKGEPTHVLVTKFTILELSAVWKGFDSGAKVGRNAVENQSAPDIPKLQIAKRDLEIYTRKVK